jgi:PST family polysaccharide transporter
VSKSLGFFVQTLWASGSQLAQAAVGVASVIILSRLLGPSEYGIYAMAIMVVGLTEIFVGTHVADILVQRKVEDRALSSTLFWLLFGLSLVCAAVLIVSAPWVALWFKQPSLTRPLYLLAVLPILTAMAAVPTQLLVRRVRFDILAGANLVAPIAGLTVAILLAKAGAGAASLAAFEIVRRVVALVWALVFARWFPSLVISRSDVSEIVTFGAQRIQSTGLRYLAQEVVPRTFIGQFLGAAALGHYTIAKRLIGQIYSVLSGPIGGVVFPAVARAQSEPYKLLRIASGSVVLATWTSWPALLGLIAIAPLLVPVALGAQWLETIPVIQILCLGALRSPLGSYVAPMLVAKGEVKLVSRIEMITLLVGGLACAAGIPFGLIGVAIGLSVKQWVQWVIGAGFLGPLIGTTRTHDLKYMLKAARPALGMFAVLMALLPFAKAYAPPELGLIGLLAIGVASFVLMWGLFYRRLVVELLLAVRQALAGQKAAARGHLSELIRQAL